MHEKVRLSKKKKMNGKRDVKNLSQASNKKRKRERKQIVYVLLLEDLLLVLLFQPLSLV
jgi:hypothetical protein